MTKQELVDSVYEAVGDGLTRKTTAEVIDSTFKALIKSIQDDGKFFMPSFGTFSVKERKARVGRNPRTGEKIDIPASKTVGFKAATALKASLKES